MLVRGCHLHGLTPWSKLKPGHWNFDKRWKKQGVRALFQKKLSASFLQDGGCQEVFSIFPKKPLVRAFQNGAACPDSLKNGGGMAILKFCSFDLKTGSFQSTSNFGAFRGFWRPGMVSQGTTICPEAIQAIKQNHFVAPQDGYLRKTPLSLLPLE